MIVKLLEGKGSSNWGKE